MGEAAADPALLRELIRMAFASRGRAGFGPKMTQTALQKTLYELRRRLPESSPVRGCLQYYWFKAGAFSELVAEEQESMVADGILREEAIPGGTLLVLPQEYVERRLRRHDGDLQEARALLSDITGAFSTTGMIRSQYEDDAPAGFYPRFKRDYMPNVESYYGSIVRGKGGNMRAERNRLERLLTEATGHLIIDPAFSGFKRAYFDFETAFCRVMRCDMKESDPRYREMVRDVVELSRKVWDAFAYGARLVRHDPAYEPRRGAWKSAFDRKVAEMSSDVERFYFRVLEVVEPHDFDERAVSMDGLVEGVLAHRRSGEVAYINFNRWPKDGVAVGRLLSERARGVPEAAALTREGQLDWAVMKELDDSQLSSVVRSCAGSEPVSVALVDGGTKFVAYRVMPSSLSAAAAAGPPR